MRRLLGFGLIAIATLLLALELLAIADPVGTKMADDGDPFGNPTQPWWFHAMWFVVVVLFTIAGVRLARNRRHQ